MEKIVFSGEHIRATAFEVEGATKLMVLFDHRRPEPGFPVVAPAEFVRSRGVSQVRLTLANMDYYLNPDLREARRAMKRYARQFVSVSALGFSLGGFGSLLFAKAMQISRVVLVSPQRPGFPQRPDMSKMDWAEEAEAYHYHPGDLGGLPADMQGCVIFDPRFNNGRDRSYARVLSTLLPSLCLVAVPGAGHPATSLLSKVGKYHLFPQTVMKETCRAGDFRAIHRQTRMLDKDYRDMIMGRVMGTRKPG